MARKKSTTRQPNPTANAEESVAGYFRRIFAENPELLKRSSNAELFERWLADHPGHEEVPQNVKYSLSNIKSVLRSKRRRRKKTVEPVAPTMDTAESPVETGPSELEQLEVMIDDCLGQAKQLDRDGLADVIDHLRRARNTVVWQIGQ
jgi:hypothetical protein